MGNSINYYECGCCGQYHPEYFDGDCRDDKNRFNWMDLEEMNVLEINIFNIED